MDFLYSLFKEFIKTLILLNTYTNTPQIGVIRISQSMAIWKLICIPWRSSESIDYHRSVCNKIGSSSRMQLFPIYSLNIYLRRGTWAESVVGRISTLIIIPRSIIFSCYSKEKLAMNLQWSPQSDCNFGGIWIYLHFFFPFLLCLMSIRY